MDRDLVDQLAADRIAQRHDDATAERLTRHEHTAHGRGVRDVGPVWALRRWVGFVLVRVGLRTALGGAR